MTISFVGHAFIPSEELVKNRVKDVLRANVKKDEPVRFYLGGYGDFDKISALCCKDLKNELSDVEIILVLPYLSFSKDGKIGSLIEDGAYDATLFPPIENVPKRFAISRRNEWMIENSDLIIAFVKNSYGGAYKSLRYAMRKNRKIINLCEI